MISEKSPRLKSESVTGSGSFFGRQTVRIRKRGATPKNVPDPFLSIRGAIAMPPMYLSESDVKRLLDMRVAIEVVEEAFRQWADHKVCNVPRTRAKGNGIVVHTMSAAADYLGLAGWKCYATTRAGAEFHVGLYDSRTGALTALIAAEWLGRLRTGATTAVAVEWMADVAAHEVGVFGTGRQARTQLEAICVARPIKQAFVYSRDETRRKTFAVEMSESLGIDVVPVDRPHEAAEELPIVVTATSSSMPLFDGKCLAEGTMVAAVGSNWLNKAEIDVNVDPPGRQHRLRQRRGMPQRGGRFCRRVGKRRFRLVAGGGIGRRRRRPGRRPQQPIKRHAIQIGRTGHRRYRPGRQIGRPGPSPRRRNRTWTGNLV